jgi:hypothetical protein
MELKIPTKDKSSLATKGGVVFPKMHVPKKQLTLTGLGGSNFTFEDGKDAGVETSRRDNSFW